MAANIKPRNALLLPTYCIYSWPFITATEKEAYLCAHEEEYNDDERKPIQPIRAGPTNEPHGRSESMNYRPGAKASHRAE